MTSGDAQREAMRKSLAQQFPKSLYFRDPAELRPTPP